MVKVYTKTGDSGTTSLFGGKRVKKDSPRLSAYGTVDELNSQIGVVIADLSYFSNKVEKTKHLSGNYPPASPAKRGEQGRIIEKLTRIQSELFVLGGDLSSPLGLVSRVVRVTPSYIKRLENEIDSWEKELAPLKNFILPGGHPVGAGLHLARAITRRAERAVAALMAQEKINPNSLIYLNRLSDWLFVAARYTNHLEKVPETIWKGRK